MNAKVVLRTRSISTLAASQIANGMLTNLLTPSETISAKASAIRNKMYSKPLLRSYVNEGLHLKSWRENQLAEALGMTPTNLSRALNQEGFNLTLQQFASLVQLLNLTPDQAFHILTGKKAKEATSQLLLSYAQKIVKDL